VRLGKIIDQGSDVHRGGKINLLMFFWIYALEQLGVNCYMTCSEDTVLSV
jgi:hypothetical protein